MLTKPSMERCCILVIKSIWQNQSWYKTLVGISVEIQFHYHKTKFGRNPWGNSFSSSEESVEVGDLDHIKEYSSTTSFSKQYVELIPGER